MAEAALVAACFTAAVYIDIPDEADLYLQFEGGALQVAIVTLTVLLARYLLADGQRGRNRPLTSQVALQAVEVIGIIFLAQSALSFVYRDIALPQRITVTGSGITFVVLLSWNLFVRPFAWGAFGAQRVLFVGQNAAVTKLADAFRSRPELGKEVTGIVVERESAATVGPVLGTVADLPQVLAHYRPDRIITGEGEYSRSVLFELFALKAGGTPVETASRAYEAAFERICTLTLQPYQVVFRNDLSSRPGSVALQSVYNNVIAIALMAAVLPVLVLLAVALRVSGASGAITTVRCAGLHGIPFDMYRFNTTGRLGRWLARYRMDRLPQVINLVRGEMALIGPRPERIEFDDELAALIPFYRQKQYVKPGLTGWSQLHCTPDRTLAALEYDLYYVKHVSPMLDVYILIHAIRMVLSGGAVAVD